MKSRALGCSLVLAAVVCSGQVPAHYVEIKLPPEVKSENFFARFIFSGQDFGDWIRPRPGVSSYAISTMIESRPATGIKAIFYAPGCAIQTLDIPLSESDHPRYSFVCQPVKNISIEGTVTRLDRLYGLDVQLEAKYIVRGARKFLGLDLGIDTSIPVGKVVDLPSDGHFRLEVPDLSQDPLAGAPEFLGEVQIWAKDKASGAIVAKLIPREPEDVKAPREGLRVQHEYVSEIVFAPCTAIPPRRDSFGFAMRPAPYDACDH
jgi:hypothetical protein